MKNIYNTKAALTTLCSPLILASVLFHSNVALADASAACVADGGTNCPSGVASISDALADVVSTITIPAGSCTAGSVTDVNVNLDISHTWIGDLDVTLVGPDAVTQSLLLDEPGEPAIGGFGCNSAGPPLSDIDALFDDASAIPAEDQCPVIVGTVSPSTALSAFNGGDGDGVWTLTIVDTQGGDTGQLNDWSLDIACTTPAGGGATPVPIFSLWGVLSLIGGLGFANRYFVRRRKKL